MPLNPEDLKEKIDISNVPIFEIHESITTIRAPYIVTCKELIDILDKICKVEDHLKKAKTALTKKLNDFIDIP